MGPLIEITNVPIEIEMKVSHAKLEYTRGTAELEISRDNGGLSIKSRPIRLNIDTFESRNSVVPTALKGEQQKIVLLVKAEHSCRKPDTLCRLIVDLAEIFGL